MIFSWQLYCGGLGSVMVMSQFAKFLIVLSTPCRMSLDCFHMVLLLIVAEKPGSDPHEPHG